MANLRMGVGLILAAGLLLTAGCNAQPRRADESGRVQVESLNLMGLVKIVRQESDRVEGGLLRIRTDLDNRQKEDLWIDIQVVWKDAKGFKVYETNWAPFMLPGRYTKTHEIVSLRADVADYEYRIRGGSKTAR